MQGVQYSRRRMLQNISCRKVRLQLTRSVHLTALTIRTMTTSPETTCITHLVKMDFVNFDGDMAELCRYGTGAQESVSSRAAVVCSAPAQTNWLRPSSSHSQPKSYPAIGSSGGCCAEWFSSSFSQAMTFSRPFGVFTAFRGVALARAGMARRASAYSDR